MNLEITEAQAEELLLAFYLSGEFIDQSGCVDDDADDREALQKDVVDKIFIGFPELEDKLGSNNQAHIFSYFRA